jgi:hypothetical protein
MLILATIPTICTFGKNSRIGESYGNSSDTALLTNASCKLLERAGARIPRAHSIIFTYAATVSSAEIQDHYPFTFLRLT